jgi:hypothetical protein
MSFPLPVDAVKWLRYVFRECNSRVSTKLSRIPTNHESSLDFTFIESLTHFESPFKTASGWIIRIETHYLGGWRQFRQWEIADIGLIVTLRQHGRLRAAKTVLLQSKRLYPNELNFDEDKKIDYEVGFGRLFHPADPFQVAGRNRSFTFTVSSQYKALLKDDNQYLAIEQYEKIVGVPVYYLLYNPRQIPWTTSIPIVSIRPKRVGPVKIGARVLPATNLRNSVAARSPGYSPAFLNLLSLPSPFNSKSHAGGWKLEHFIVDLVLGCKAGHLAKDQNDLPLHAVFARRDAPISAAIGITIDAPGGADLLSD